MVGSAVPLGHVVGATALSMVVGGFGGAALSGGIPRGNQKFEDMNPAAVAIGGLITAGAVGVAAWGVPGMLAGAVPGATAISGPGRAGLIAAGVGAGALVAVTALGGVLAGWANADAVERASARS